MWLKNFALAPVFAEEPLKSGGSDAMRKNSRLAGNV